MGIILSMIIPSLKNDDVLNRYVDLRFSVNTGDVVKKQ